MHPKISVVIPVYNVESYLEECWLSVASQTYNNYEIILIDDGSTDNSGRMCDSYAEDKENVIVIHQENQGLSGARNTGVKHSTGEYITFVDSDDVISDDCLEILTGTLSDNSDIVIAGMCKFFDNIPEKKRDDTSACMLDNATALRELCRQRKLGGSACAKLYKRYLVEKHPYPIGELYEDVSTTHILFGEAKGINYTHQVVYYYRQRRNSITNHSGIFPKDFDGLKAAKKLYDYVSMHFPESSNVAKGRCVIAGFDLLRLIRSGSKDDRTQFKQIKDYVRPFSHDVLSANDVDKKTKIKCLSIVLGYFPAVTCSKIFEVMRAKVNG